MATASSPTTVIRYEQKPDAAGTSVASNVPGYPPTGPSMSGALPDSWHPTKVTDAGLPGQPFARPVRVFSPQEIPKNIKTARLSVEHGLKELLAFQQRRPQADGVAFLEQFRLQSANVLDELMTLRGEVSDIIRAAERHRWRKWLLGGLAAVIIPAVKAIWKRPRHDSESSNKTEYAFFKSQSLISRILNAVRSSFGGLASITFFVFAVLYVFQNEVSLRVAKTMSRRLKRLHAKLERGDQAITQADLKTLRGWRWRILL
ncbi:hypothetical protein KVR01_009627 [Diaporthe batatas]|uniref:uncharacterized protein n=1 Tax=Diaporthe batatas TaxID=748121 RepID=UPI001D05AA38|nr:uncharacterized protein KVR01_009627 [Diaporthe batatas]KAG8161363.1 hypothetical protein KVR01_009627 [Diaporthe batatas]